MILVVASTETLVVRVSGQGIWEEVLLYSLMCMLAILLMGFPFWYYRTGIRHIVRQRRRLSCRMVLNQISTTFLSYGRLSQILTVLLIVWLGATTLSLYACWYALTHRPFVAAELTDVSASLRYNIGRPVVLSWDQVQSIDLVKRRSGSKWRIEVRTREGHTFRSYQASTASESKELERAFHAMSDYFAAVSTNR